MLENQGDQGGQSPQDAQPQPAPAQRPQQPAERPIIPQPLPLRMRSAVRPTTGPSIKTVLIRMAISSSQNIYNLVVPAGKPVMIHAALSRTAPTSLRFQRSRMRVRVANLLYPLDQYTNTRTEMAIRCVDDRKRDRIYGPLFQ